VLNERVDGGLAVSRALGDFEYKMRSDLPQRRQRVSAEPDVTVIERQFAEDEFLLLACDGIWDVMTNQGAAKFIHSRLKKGDASHARTACDRLIKRCLDLGSRDNMSALVVIPNLAFRHQPAYEPETPLPTLEEASARIAQSLVYHVLRSGIDKVIEERQGHLPTIRAMLIQEEHRYLSRSVVKETIDEERDAEEQPVAEGYQHHHTDGGHTSSEHMDHSSASGQDDSSASGQDHSPQVHEEEDGNTEESDFDSEPAYPYLHIDPHEEN
jgi:hypothetical protein